MIKFRIMIDRSLLIYSLSALNNKFSDIIGASGTIITKPKIKCERGSLSSISVISSTVEARIDK